MKLKEWIDEKNLRIMDVAIKLNMHPNRVHAYLRGERPHPKIAKAIEQLTEGKVTRLEVLYPDEY